MGMRNRLIRMGRKNRRTEINVECVDGIRWFYFEEYYMDSYNLVDLEKAFGCVVCQEYQ